ncbi:MAG TPA: SO2930 family diheme c-type cytochrome [Kofleriaceae bacterium]|nr:SO2930 family diheme c-type cytochrome [Kofleriaceae bacterium]
MRTWLLAATFATLATLAPSGLAACGGSDDDGATDVDAGGVDLTKPVSLDLAAPPADKLSAYNLFAWDPASGFTFNETGGRIVPYDLNTPLFSDHALKQRAIYVPPGAAATYDPELAFDLPVGSVVIKNFLFPADFRDPTANVKLIETRLLVRHDDGWHPLPYIWDADQRDATYSPAGEVRPIQFVDEHGASQTASYLVPQRNQCQTCHGRKETPDSPLVISLIGIKARHLNRSYDYGGAVGTVNQLDRLTAAGLLTGAPPAADAPKAYDFRPIEAGGVAAIPPADLDAAARSYLDINCSHCHSPTGVQGMTSQLFLDHGNTDLFRLGVCKRPGSAGAGTGGFTFDIVPGDPDTSILYFRVHTDQVGAMMPLLGRSLVHARGAELLHAWIAQMAPMACE